MTRQKAGYTLQDFIPLILIISFIILIMCFHQWHYGWQLDSAMRVMMATFFLVFGFFKVINVQGFAKAYRMYDLIAQRYAWYGYIYPFIEIGLGLAYLYSWQLFYVNIATVCIMLIGAAGVFNELRKGKQITCACLGALFTIPMTYVTLAEDLLMAGMALWMLLRGY